LVRNDPTLNLESPKSEKKLPCVLSLNEVEKLVSQPDEGDGIGSRDKSMLELLYATGIRVSELVCLDVNDINLDLGYVRCNSSNNKERVIPIGTMAQKALDNYVNYHRDKLTKDDESALFVNYYGKRLTRQGFWKIIKRYTKLAQIEKKITPQTLRHSFATHLLNNGARISDVSELLGHETMATTQVYTKLGSVKKMQEYMKAHPLAKNK